MRVLVTGGAGYIGSHACKALAEAGYQPVVLDNMSRGHEWAVQWGPLVEADVRDSDAVRRTIRDYRCEAVLHFAAVAYVGESVVDPRKYFENNVEGTLSLLGAMLDEGVHTLVFSSTCATYGNPQILPLREDHPQDPVNPYGDTKFLVERILRWYETPYQLKYAALRYFNAAGADPDLRIGEAHQPETHLIPLAIHVAQGKREHLAVFGDDYPTVDGTAVRDYIHVSDLADAHVRALEYLIKGGHSVALNLGTGCGHSVQEVVTTVERVSGQSIPVQVGPRRAGDPPALVACADEAYRLIGWKPRFSSLQEICSTAWAWHSKVPY